MNYVNSIGGFINFRTLTENLSDYQSEIGLNSGRNCLSFLIDCLNIKRIFLPYYICNDLRLMVEGQCKVYYYHISEDLEPEYIPDDEYFVYVNYFGIKDKFIKSLSFHKKVIIDCCQSFFTFTENISFSSPRKFFPVIDGGYLHYRSKDCLRAYKKLPDSSDFQASANFLYEELDRNHNVYGKYRENELSINKSEVMKISKSTRATLSLIDFDKLRKVRLNNFYYLDDKLKNLNELVLGLDLNIAGPMAYPLLCGGVSRREIIDKGIFIGRYWEDLHKDVNEFERYLSDHLLALPVDHRYGLAQMNTVIDIIKNLREGS